MKAFAFALLLAATFAFAGDPPVPPPEPQLRLFKFPPEPQMGIPRIPELPTPPRSSVTARYWICPKDETMLRVVKPNHKGAFECPVDGTPMKPAVGRSSAIFLLNEEAH